ncbi:secretoglobin family 3A member 1 [Dasypus novemcinctus]|uniref:secretoglobin family 3A member 1 n=1 Tax=Dasypus novemcinctus TaxID=9361 RepID=UPI00265E68E6|nr:secretoglobin family 3A member 1 [Dasypus novemcinctus]
MKLPGPVFVLCASLLGGYAAAFFVNSVAKPAAQPVAAVAPGREAVAGAGASPFLNYANPLKLMLASLGIPVDRLVEGSRKCVAELGPEAVGAVKMLLGALTLFG